VPLQDCSAGLFGGGGLRYLAGVGSFLPKGLLSLLKENMKDVS
jgi:hypothetical protein